MPIMQMVQGEDDGTLAASMDVWLYCMMTVIKTMTKYDDEYAINIILAPYAININIHTVIIIITNHPHHHEHQRHPDHPHTRSSSETISVLGAPLQRKGGARVQPAPLLLFCAGARCWLALSTETARRTTNEA